VTCSDFKAIGEAHVAEFERRLATIPEDVCGQFNEEARSLEVMVLTLYKAVVLATKREDDLAAVANLWGCMVEVCDIGAMALQRLVKDHPYCGAELYYDRLLDIRNKCRRLQSLHS
jgi:hypothetical protein